MRLTRFLNFAAVGSIILASPGSARSQGWEVASIKPSRDRSTESNFNSLPGGRLIATNITVKELLLLAFGVKDYQVERAPGWLDGERFDINAKAASARRTSLDDQRSLVRELLTDRFRMTTHRETRQAPVYLLVVAKDGVKLTPKEGPGAGTRKGCGHLAGRHLTMETIATVLSRQFSRDVLDRTGLSGKFDFELDWTPDSGPCPGAAEALPSIFTAIQQQLGLKLESAKGPVEFLVIDHVERPSEN